MKRIIAILSGKLDEAKKERKVKRLTRAIETAIDNAQEAAENAAAEMDDIVETLPDATDLNSYVQSISDKMDEIETQEKVIACLKKVKEYLEKDIPVK